jgi:hypothetical protein
LINDLVSFYSPFGLIQNLDDDHIAMHRSVEILTADE